MVAIQITGFSPIWIQRLTVERPKYLIEFEVDVDINHIYLTLLQVKRWLDAPCTTAVNVCDDRELQGYREGQLSKPTYDHEWIHTEYSNTIEPISRVAD